MNNIIARIKKRRTDLDMSYQELAKKTGLSKSTLQRYETGSIKNMPIDKLEVIANALDISPAYLMGWEKIDTNKKENNKTETSISIKEHKLLKSFNELNEIGKDEAIKRVYELTLIPSYKEDNQFEIDTIAAHNDHLDEEGEMENIIKDLEDMDNW